MSVNSGQQATSSRTASLYELREYSQEILRPYQERVPNLARHFQCGKETWKKLSAVQYEESGRTGIEGYVTCDKYLICPTCGNTQSQNELKKIHKAIDAWIANGKTVIQVDLSFAHHRKMRLDKLLQPLLDAFSSKTIHEKHEDDNAFFYFKETYGLVGYIKVLEVVYSTEAGWNPHFHALMFLDMPQEELSEAAIEVIQALIFDWWNGALKQMGLPGASPVYGVHIQRVTTPKVADYILKAGRHKDRKDAESLTINELIERAAKGDMEAVELLLEYVLAVYGSDRGKALSRVRFSPKFGKLITPAVEPALKPNKTKLKDFTPEEFEVIKRHGLRPHIQSLKSRDEIEALLRKYMADEHEAVDDSIPLPAGEQVNASVQEPMTRCLPISVHGPTLPPRRQPSPHQRRRQHPPKPAIERVQGRPPPDRAFQ